uniref:Uncharacterized protein n=1 Tax=Arundo donax TaxID=35708 RepID=A0A0A9G2N0_ARUDO
MCCSHLSKVTPSTSFAPGLSGHLRAEVVDPIHECNIAEELEISTLQCMKPANGLDHTASCNRPSPETTMQSNWSQLI